MSGMSAALNKRLSKVEEISARREIGSGLDRCLEKTGTSRAEMLAAFCDWLAAGVAATDDQAGVTLPTVVGGSRGIRKMGCDF